MNIHCFTIPENIEETKLLPLMKRMLPELPEYAIREAFLKKDIKMNGIRVPREVTALPGAKVQMYTRYEGGGHPIPILYEDEAVVIVRKPRGVSCEEDAKGGKTVPEMVADHLRKEDVRTTLPLLCHRLDNQTEGLLLLAKTEEAQEHLMNAFKQHKIQKTYVCKAKGTPSPRHAVLRAFLVKDAAKGRVAVFQKPVSSAQPIVTEYDVLEEGEVSRLLITLHTGRTHQIRAQLSAIGHPVLGDDLYGDRTFNKAYKTHRLMLCATSLSFALDEPFTYLNEHVFRTEPSF